MKYDFDDAFENIQDGIQMDSQAELDITETHINPDQIILGIGIIIASFILAFIVMYNI